MANFKIRSGSGRGRSIEDGFPAVVQIADMHHISGRPFWNGTIYRINAVGQDYSSLKWAGRLG
jgi:hypothetical protein